MRRVPLSVSLPVAGLTRAASDLRSRLASKTPDVALIDVGTRRRYAEDGGAGLERRLAREKDAR